MKLEKKIFSSLCGMVLVLLATPTFGDEAKRVWQTSACYHLRLSVWDKMSQGRFVAKYVVTSADGRVFTAEKKATDDISSGEVFFPDHFRDAKTNIKAWVNCRYGENYSWEIYANGALIDSGTIVFSRKQQK